MGATVMGDTTMGAIAIAINIICLVRVLRYLGLPRIFFKVKVTMETFVWNSFPNSKSQNQRKKRKDNLPKIYCNRNQNYLLCARAPLFGPLSINLIFHICIKKFLKLEKYIKKSQNQWKRRRDNLLLNSLSSLCVRAPPFGPSSNNPWYSTFA